MLYPPPPLFHKLKSGHPNLAAIEMLPILKKNEPSCYSSSTTCRVEEVPCWTQRNGSRHGQVQLLLSFKHAQNALSVPHGTLTGSVLQTADALRRSSSHTCGKVSDRAVSAWQDVPVRALYICRDPNSGCCFSFPCFLPHLLLLSPAGGQAETDTKRRSDPCWQKWVSYLRPVALGIAFWRLGRLQPVRYTSPDPAWSVQLVIVFINFATRWEIFFFFKEEKIPLLELRTRLWACGCSYFCVNASVHLWVDLRARVCVHACIMQELFS